jgi:predicted lipoprotein with Yx(FWY)xxD motif
LAAGNTPAKATFALCRGEPGLQWRITMRRFIASALMVSAMAMFAYAADEPAKVADSTMGKIWVDPNGMTLYTFEKDVKGQPSACKDDCIAEWPPLLAPDGAQAMDEWTLVDVVDKDGATKKMWAYDGMPLYLFVDDKKPGDITGDGEDGFHVAKADEE